MNASALAGAEAATRRMDGPFFAGGLDGGTELGPTGSPDGSVEAAVSAWLIGADIV
jgi:hypothetical protein